MNRRQLLKSFAVLTASSSSVALLSYLASPTPEAADSKSLPSMLIQSQQYCREHVGRRVHSPRSAYPLATAHLQELSLLIDRALYRHGAHGVQSAAFWQACSDAFSRATDCVGKQQYQNAFLQRRTDLTLRCFTLTQQMLDRVTAHAIKTVQMSKVC